MNKFKRFAVPCLALGLLVPTLSGAQDGPWHFGGSIGQADVNEDFFDEAVQLQGAVGYDVWEHSWGVISGELGVGTTVGGGDIDLPFLDAEWEVTTIGLAATYRMSDLVFYPLARVGFQYADMSIESEDDSDSGLIAGIGAGLQATESIAVELSWTRQFSFSPFDADDLELDIIALGVRF